MADSYPQITLHTRPWCGAVIRVKRWLDQRNIPYQTALFQRNQAWE